MRTIQLLTTQISQKRKDTRGLLDVPLVSWLIIDFIQIRLNNLTFINVRTKTRFNLLRCQAFVK